MWRLFLSKVVDVMRGALRSQDVIGRWAMGAEFYGNFASILLL
ncbi:MAG: hypothetical protein P8N23_04030 [Methylophilaceae bacterium]|nr:hypothetical protein [Methylophilaceae bacterium]